MCEKADESGWSRVLSDAEPSGEETRRSSADMITPSGGFGMQAKTVGGTDNPGETQTPSEQTGAEVRRTIYTTQGKLTPPGLLTRQEQTVGFTDQAKEQPQEAVLATINTTENAVYKDTTGKAGNVMQDVDKPISQVAGPALGRAAETASVATPTMMSSIPSRETGSSVVETVMQNPLPAALMGLGLSWLLMNMYQSRKKSVDYDAKRVDRHLDRQIPNTLHTSSHGQPVMSQTHGADNNMFEDAQEIASSVASQIRDEVSDIADRTREQVSNLTSRVQQGARRVRYQYQQSLQENPLAVGAAALALGSAIGLALPSTPVEDKLMGKAHENLMHKVDEATHGTVQKVREVAGEAGRAARKEAEVQGLHA